MMVKRPAESIADSMNGRARPTPELQLGSRKIGRDHPPLVVAEIGINHDGDFSKAEELVRAAAAAGCECVKFQCHIPDDEMAPQAKEVVPANASESIYSLIDRCALGEEEDRRLKALTEDLGMIYLSTPFGRAAANRLERLDVVGFKVGSGECNNLPLLRHISAFDKPIILSTGMNDLESVRRSLSVIAAARPDRDRKRRDVAIMHVTSLYPTPYEHVRLGAMSELADALPDCPVGLSDHSAGIYCCLGAVALGASILERHFTVSRSWPGPDISISTTPDELRELIRGSRAIWEARGGSKEPLPEERPTIDFAFASVVTIAQVEKGERLTRENCWVKRPGTGEIHAREYDRVLGGTARRDLPEGHQVRWSDLEPAVDG